MQRWGKPPPRRRSAELPDLTTGHGLVEVFSKEGPPYTWGAGQGCFPPVVPGRWAEFWRPISLTCGPMLAYTVAEPSPPGPVFLNYGPCIAGGNLLASKARSSIGRAAVSKTAGCTFESCRACQIVCRDVATVDTVRDSTFKFSTTNRGE